MLLSKEQLKAVQDVTSVVVPVPEWGGEVKLRGLTLAEAEAIPAGDGYSHRLLAASWIDEAGSPVWDSAEDLGGWIRQRAAGPANRLFRKLVEINGLTDEAARKLDDDAKKASATQAAGS